MGVTVLNMDLVCEDSAHTVTPCAPNMCITPGAAAGAPGPLPYPITASSSKLDPGTSKTKQKGKKILNAKASVKSCNGNQPGTQKDVTTMQTTKKSWPLPVPAVTVHFEGVPVAITGNPGFGNSL